MPLNVFCVFLFWSVCAIFNKNQINYHIFQSAAGFMSYFVVMGENGFLPYTLIGLRKNWEDPNAIVTDSYGQDWVRIYRSFCRALSTYSDRVLLSA